MKKRNVVEGWSVPREWGGCGTAFVLGGGPSIRALGHDKLIAKINGRYPVVATNTSYLLYPEADVLFGADQKWWADSEQWLHRHVGWWKVTRTAPSIRMPWPLMCISADHAGGLSLDPKRIRGRNSGHMAMNLAVHFGAPQIVLVGVDLDPKGVQHWHDLHTRRPSVESYATWIKDWEQAVPVLAKAGVRVLNANPGSALKCFPFCDLEEFF